MQENSSMILLDEDVQWDGDGKVIAHWTQLDFSPGQESIPQKVEEQALSIKKEYLAWVYDLGKYKVEGQTLISFLKIFDNFSFWWLTRIAAKSPLRSSCIYPVFKLRVLEKLYVENGCQGLIYCGHEKDLNEVLKKWCEELGHPYRRFSGKSCASKSQLDGIRGWFLKFPYLIQAMAYLIRKWFAQFRYLKQRGTSKAIHPQEDDQVTLVTYFPNIDLEKAESGRFWSHYWGNLHELLDDLPCRVNWVWLYSNSAQLSYRDSVSLRDRCNSTSPDKYQHFLAEEFLSNEAFFKSLKLYLKIFSKGLLLGEVRKAFCFPGSKLNFFPMMKYDWKSSFFGKDAIEGVLSAVIFDSIAKNLPATPWGVFNWENQPWELSLVAAWKRHQSHTKIYAYQHSIILSQDLRPFLDSRVYEQGGVEAFPLPDKLALNSPLWEPLMKEFNFPEEKITPVEALRYSYLRGSYEKEKKDIKSSGRVLLVVTGFDRFETQKQLSLLIKADKIDGLKKYEKVTFKPHPDFPVDEILTALKPNFNFTVASQPLKELWSIADVAYCANSTSGSIEAAYLGIPLIIVGPANNLNLNPLCGFSSIQFVTDPNGLCEELNDPHRINIPKHYFNLDENLILWKNLLGAELGKANKN